MVIYIKKGAEQSGPYSLGQVKEKLAEGKLQPEDMACQEGNMNWAPLSQLISEAAGIPPTMTASVPLGNSGSAEKPSLIDAPAPVEDASSTGKPSLIGRCFKLIFGIRPAFVAAVVVIILLVYWQDSRTEGTPVTSKWVQYQNQLMGLEMRFPFTPQQEIKSAGEGPFGKKKIVSLISDTERGKKRFGVIVQNFEQHASSSEFLYKILVKGLAKETKGKIKKEGPLKINGDSGWEFYLDGQDSGSSEIHIQGQITSRGKNIYTVFIRYLEPQPPKEAGFFFKSFKLTGSVDEDGEGAQASKPNDRVGSKEPGTVLWEFKTGHWVSSSPAIGSDGTIYVGSWDKKVYAINGKTGVKLWEFETGGKVHLSSPAIGPDGAVYVGSDDNKLYAINGKSGVKLWGFETGGSVNSSPAIGSDGTVYVGSYDKKLYAINGKSGAKKWEFETGNSIYGVQSSPAIGSDGTVYVGSNDSKLYALNGKSGVKKWEFKTGHRVESSPAIGSDGTVYVGSNDSKLYALDGKSGVKLWEFETGGAVIPPAIGSDGTVYVGSMDKKLCALKTSSKGLAKSPWPMRGQNPQHTGRAPK